MIYAGVELGGTKCIAILARDAEDVIARAEVPTTNPDDTLGALETILAQWKAEEGFEALGIASFGPIDVDPASPGFGHLRATTKPGWQRTDIGPRLQRATGVPLRLDTDVNGAAFSELRWGAGRGLEDFAYITVGTGIGVGLIVNGRPTRGFGHCELGHIRVARLPDDNWAGSCSFHGDCAEGVASGSALKARFGDEVAALAPDHPVWESVVWTVAQLCHAIVLAAAPRRIAIGGGVMVKQPQLIEAINAKLAESLNDFVELPTERNYVCAPELGKDAGPLGAIALAMMARA